MGRSKGATGPYLDRAGKAMVDGGGAVNCLTAELLVTCKLHVIWCFLVYFKSYIVVECDRKTPCRVSITGLQRGAQLLSKVNPAN